MDGLITPISVQQALLLVLDIIQCHKDAVCDLLHCQVARNVIYFDDIFVVVLCLTGADAPCLEKNLYFSGGAVVEQLIIAVVAVERLAAGLLEPLNIEPMLVYFLHHNCFNPFRYCLRVSAPHTALIQGGMDAGSLSGYFVTLPRHGP